MVAFSKKEQLQAGDIQLRSRKIEQLLKKIVAHDRPFKRLIKEAKPYIAYNTYKNLDYFRKNRNTQGHDYSLSDHEYKKLINISDDIINELEKVIQQRTTTSDNNVNKQTDNKNNILDINNTEYNADNCKEIIITSISQIIKFLDDKGAKGIDILEKFESLKDSFPKEKYHNYLTKTNRLNHIYNLAKDKEDIGKELFDCFVSEFKVICQELNNISNDKTGSIILSESQRTKIRDARKELLESLEKIGGKGVLLVDKLECLKKILPQDKYKVLEWQVNYVDNIWGVIVNSKYVSQENYDGF